MNPELKPQAFPETVYSPPHWSRALREEGVGGNSANSLFSHVSHTWTCCKMGYITHSKFDRVGGGGESQIVSIF